MPERLRDTAGEAAGAISVSRGLAYQLVTRGDLRTARVGRRIVVPQDTIREFLGLGQEQPPALPTTPLAATPESSADEVSYLVTIRRVRAGGAMNTPSLLSASW
jgi:excisionase family DNA binding protein